MASHFLTKTRARREQLIDLGGVPALERYPALRALLAERVSERAAGLFAEPLLSLGNDETPATVSWYTDVEGEGAPLTSLDGAARAAAEAELSGTLRAIRPLLAERSDAPMVGAALHLTSPADIWVVAGHPVIINWGMFAEGVGRGGETREKQYGRTLGRYLALSAVPPITEAEWRDQASAEAPRGAAAAAAPTEAPVSLAAAAIPAEAPRAAPPAPPAPPPPPAPDQAERRGGGWLPLLLLLLLAAGTLLWLLWPGTRIFPPAGDPLVTDDATLRMANEVTASLEARKAALEAAVAGAVCTADGTLLLPDGRTPDGLLPPAPGDPADAPGMPTEAAPDPALPVDPARLRVTDPGAPAGEETLLRRIETSTAMVVAAGEDSTGWGTGFFVGPDLLVTNYHVVAEADPARIFVTNDTLGGLRGAEVLKLDGPREQTGHDFALLRVADAGATPFAMFQSPESLRLRNVIAAGYPGDILENDAKLDALMNGDATAVPELVVTDGVVNAEQTLTPPSEVLVHSAPISRGNSGGPLVDSCGRVVGVNTFGSQAEFRTLFFAQSVGDLMAFLEGTPARPAVDSEPCQPVVTRAPAPPRVAGAEATDETPPATPAAP